MTTNIIVQGTPPTIIVTPQANPAVIVNPPSTPTVVIEKPIGISGREVEIRRSGDYLQWRYVGEINWTNILPLVDIKGDTGIQGIQGIRGIQGIQGVPGEEVQLRKNIDKIEWKRTDETTWTTLILLTDIKGDQGIQGVQGLQGADGDQVELQKTATHIQWKYTDEATWTNLVALTDIKGDQGIQGIPGQDGSDGTQGIQGIPGIQGLPGDQVELQISATHIQWRYVGEATWTDLIALSAITGADGNDGAPGTDGLPGAAGADGIAVEIQNSGTYIQWRYVGDVEWTNIIAISAITGADGAAGSDGREIEIQNSGTAIEWRYVGDVSWTQIVTLAAITGPAGAAGSDGAAGAPGLDGADGEVLQIQVTATHIQYKYESDVDWTNLIALADITGADGSDGAAGAAGKSILNGTIDPTTEGIDGEFYINTSTLQIFGPKIAGVWGTGTNITGAAGADGNDGAPGADGEQIQIQVNATHIQWKYESDLSWTDLIALSAITGAAGAPGTDGSDGSNGLSVLNGTIDPTTEGVDGEFYINTTSWEIFGPKTAGAWGTGTSLIGTGEGGAINDAVIALDSTWSSSKIDGLIGDIESTLDAIIGV